MTAKMNPFQIAKNAGVDWQQWTTQTVDPDHWIVRINHTRLLALGLVPSTSELANAIQKIVEEYSLPIQFGTRCPSDDGSIRTDAPKGMFALVLRGNSHRDLEVALTKLIEFITMLFPKLQSLFEPATADEGLATSA